MALFVGTDIGGTFTDLVGYDTGSKALFFGKTLTANADLVEGVMRCLAETGLKPEAVDVLKHGTTQVINALLERKGAKTALVTTKGFRDILEIGRAGRPRLRDPARVLADVRSGYISREAAERDYAVVIDAAGNVDVAKTRAQREKQ